ncbi:MAG UNVERIFIED_CONTAM: hypothetical protein LVR18_37370 [Planctomycetaceae bacterium]
MSPLPGSLSNDCYESSSSIGSDERSISAHAATPRSCGDCPRDRALSSDCCESSGSIGSNERSITAHAAPPPSCGDCPRYRVRLVATIANLRVLSVLMNDPSPAAPCPTPQLRGLSPRPGSLSNDCCESSGSIGSDERSIAADAGTPRSCGECPRNWGPEWRLFRIFGFYRL